MEIISFIKINPILNFLKWYKNKVNFISELILFQKKKKNLIKGMKILIINYFINNFNDITKKLIKY